MAKLTEAQRRNLENVRDHKKPLPGSPAGYNCRIAGLSEFIWLVSDGSEIRDSEIEFDMFSSGKELVRIIREELTPAGRAALEGKG